MSALPEPRTRSLTFQEAMEELRQRHHPEREIKPTLHESLFPVTNLWLWLFFGFVFLAITLALWQPFRLF